MKEECFHLGLKALIRNSKNEFLILKALSKSREYFDLPGGRIHKNESLEQGLTREVFEETGITKFKSMEPIGMFLSDIRIKVNLEEIGLIHYFYFCEVDNPNITLSLEHISYEWCNAKDAIEKLFKKVPENLIIKLLEHAPSSSLS